MLMTEEQARSKWCPHARNAGVTNRDTGSAASVNRGGPEHYGAENCNCVASDCAAWRWAGEKTAYQRLVGRNDPTPEPPWAPTGRVSTAGREVWEMDAGSRSGYCGAFGKPEA